MPCECVCAETQRGASRPFRQSHSAESDARVQRGLLHAPRVAPPFNPCQSLEPKPAIVQLGRQPWEQHMRRGRGECRGGAAVCGGLVRARGNEHGHCVCGCATQRGALWVCRRSSARWSWVREGRALRRRSTPLRIAVCVIAGLRLRGRPRLLHSERALLRATRAVCAAYFLILFRHIPTNNSRARTDFYAGALSRACVLFLSVCVCVLAFVAVSGR